ncbi:MBL fold metallo-hydrolase [Massilia sp. S19_KUP03_FR1]|uniref:MBL fold metallo-hydrolase n=1 Tax=Massilia sp. S19_KUP03_FR1 TaxID=3025503 RepID=UPI002FCD95D5
MMTRRDLLKTAAATGVTTAMMGSKFALAANAGLRQAHFPAGENGFFRAPVLISGATEAILIDAGFTFADAQTLIAAIKKTGKKLTMIYISQSDPDYYFGLRPLKAAFPQARIVAASATIAAIKASVDKKLATWGPQLKENGPQTLADIVIPEAFDGPSLHLENHTIDIVDATGMANRRYLWSPSLKMVLGGVLVFSGTHVWTADTATVAARASWIKNLDAMAARKPISVIPGHMTPAAATDISAVKFTRDYLLAFDEALAKTANSAELIAAMTTLYPDLGMGIALQIGAKVAKGEMPWG